MRRAKRRRPYSDQEVQTLAPFVKHIAEYHRTLRRTFENCATWLDVPEGRSEFIELLRGLREGAFQSLANYGFRAVPTGIEAEEKEFDARIQDGRDILQVAVSLHLFALTDSALRMVTTFRKLFQWLRQKPEKLRLRPCEGFKGEMPDLEAVEAEGRRRLSELDLEAEAVRAVHHLLGDEPWFEGSSWQEGAWAKLFIPDSSNPVVGKDLNLVIAVAFGGITYGKTSLGRNSRLRGALKEQGGSTSANFLEELPSATLEGYSELAAEAALRPSTKELVARTRNILEHQRGPDTEFPQGNLRRENDRELEPSVPGNPEDEFTLREEAARLPELVEKAGLTPREREVLEFHHLTSEEIGKRLRIDANTARVHRHKAIGKLRRAAGQS